MLTAAYLYCDFVRTILRCHVKFSGDSAYALALGLLTPYADNGKLTAPQKNFNYRLSSTRMIVENANARLKNKWRRLKKIYTTTIERAKEITIACLVLHNFLLKYDAEHCYSDFQHRDIPSFTTAEEKRSFITEYLKT